MTLARGDIPVQIGPERDPLIWHETQILIKIYFANLPLEICIGCGFIQVAILVFD